MTFYTLRKKNLASLKSRTTNPTMLQKKRKRKITVEQDWLKKENFYFF